MTTAAPAARVPESQAWFAHELASVSPVGITPASERAALILAGSQSGFTSILRTLVGAGRPLLIESPSYWGVILAAKHAGVQLEPIAAGPEGPDPEDLDRPFSLTGARAFYAQPSFANPTGAQWSREVARSVLEVVRRHGAFLIEDDWAHGLSIDAEPQPVAALDDSDHVIYFARSSKGVSPSLRVAAVIARGPARERILVETTPAGGLHLWVRVPEHINIDQLTTDCESHGVVIVAGRDWFPAEPTGNYIRLNYAAENPERFSEAASIIGHTLKAPSQ